MQIGVVQGGYNPVGLPGDYGDINDWTPVNLFLDWIAQNDPLRKVTAAPGNFNWSNPAAWVDSVPGVVSAVPNNTVISYTAGARYYDVTLSNPGTITLDMNPTIDNLSIMGPQSQLVIGATHTLEVLLGTTLSDGKLTMAGGTLATSQFLMSGGLLTGNGTIAGSPNFQGPCGFNVCVTVNNGMVVPDGTLTIQGNYTQTGPQSQLVIGATHTLEVLLGTTLSDGKLTMAGGTLATSQFLMSGGLLTGNGTIAGSPNFQGPCGFNVCVTVNNGMVVPDGTLTIQGNYTQTGGLLQFQLAPTGVSGKLAVTNTAALGGTSTLGVTMTPGLYGLTTSYTLLTAGVITGQFPQFMSVAPHSAFLSLSDPFYTATSVDVTVTRTPFGAVAGLTKNQQAVGNALEGAYRTTLTGPAAMLYGNLLVTGTPNSLSQLSGEGTSAAQNTAFASGTMFNEVLMDQSAFWRNGETVDSSGVTYRTTPLAYAAEKKKSVPAAFKALKEKPPVYEPRGWRVWTAGFGGVQSFSGDAVVGSADARTSGAGGSMGFDYQIDPTRLVGFAVGGSDGHFSVPGRATSGDVLGGHVGAYGVATWGALYAAGVLSYSRFDEEVRRTIAGVGATETASGRFASDLFGARLELGRTYALPWLNVTPFAAVQTATLWQRGFSETTTAGGLPGILGLTYGSQTTTSLPTFLGVQLDARYAWVNGMMWSPFVRAAWMHEFNRDRSIAGSFVSVPGTLFGVDGARAWSDALKVNAGSRLALNQYASLFASFDGEFANNGHSYGGRGGIRFSW